MTNPSKNKTQSETSEDTPEEKTEQSSSPKRLLIPFSHSAEEALEAVKTHLGAGENTEESSKEEVSESE